MSDPLDAWRATHPNARFGLLGAGPRRASWAGEIDGEPLVWWNADERADLAAQYLDANREAFPSLPLPAWVLSDVYLVASAIALVVDGSPGQERIVAAWVGVPSLGGDAVGVSLLSQERGAGALAKWIGARAMRLPAVRGVTQATSRSIRTHTRLGPMQIVGRAPLHDHDASLVYRTDLSDPSRVCAAMSGRARYEHHRIAVSEPTAVDALLDRAVQAKDVWLVPPGVQDGGLCVAFAVHEPSPAV